MAGSQRHERLAEQAKLEVAEILRKMKDPRIGFVSVTDVEASHDLRHLDVYVSVLGSDEERERTMEALAHGTGFVRTELGQRIRLRYTPEVVFHFDPSLARGAHIMELLNQVKQGNDSPQGSGEQH